MHLRPRAVGLVALGGAAGTGVREALALTWPTAAGGFPVTIFAINIVGAFVLGVLLEFLGRRGSDEGRRRAARLLLGTGVLGGFTTYSTFMTDTANLAVTDHALGVALAYAAASLLVGVAASALGVALGSRIHETARRRATLEPAPGETTRSTGASR
nr:CrcB family protein [Frondihabitans australicus]